MWAATHPPPNDSPRDGGIVPIQPTVEADEDRARVTAECLRIVRGGCPDQAPLAETLFARVQPPRWELEWDLPRWLGEAFGLDDRVVTDIVVSNVLGLGSIRLQDDLVDGDVPFDEIAGARRLQAALYEAALQPYRAMFDARSPFWPALDQRMRQWRVATRACGPTNAAGDQVPDASRLATRGAPLHVSVLAVCLAAGHPECYPPLGRSLDHLLEAQVLYDDAADWVADLDAERWNAFVAALSPVPDGPTDRKRRRNAIIVSLMTSDDATAYFERIRDQFSRAIAAADQLPVPVPRLVEHIRSLASQFEKNVASHQEHFHELGNRAARLLVQRSPTMVDDGHGKERHVRMEEAVR
jgi:hypothetical protein